ncbi:MAG: NADH-quinone oxidoreductase subunit C [Fidelibacterota bacterium]
MDFTEQVNYINEHFREGFIDTGEEAPADHILVAPADWKNFAEFLRNDENLFFDALMCITGVDFGEESDLGVIYNLHSMQHNHKIEIRIILPRENPVVPSVEQFWKIADWFERETFDMYGIEFEGHHNLCRILLPDDWEGYPLRKDYEFPSSYHGIEIPKMKEGWE